eukprot:12786878-Alexandrium_andersonii.AAC.1
MHLGPALGDAPFATLLLRGHLRAPTRARKDSRRGPLRKGVFPGPGCAGGGFADRDLRTSVCGRGLCGRASAAGGVACATPAPAAF